MSEMKMIFLSHTELESLSRFWERYVKRNSESEYQDDPLLQQQMNNILEEVSDETRDTFLDALDAFELRGEEFEVRIAPDDANLVNA